MEQEDLSGLVAFLAETPRAVRRLAEGFSDEELRHKPSGDEFSFVENVCHLRDIEREGYNRRIERLLNESDPLLPDLDGARLAFERAYNSQDFAAGLGDFEGARGRSVGLLENLSAEQLARGGRFEGVGAVTLGQLVSMMYEHDCGHRDELSVLRERLLRRRRAAGA